MQVLCGIDLRSGVDLVRRVVALVGGTSPELTLAHVVDVGPRRDLEQRWSAMRGSPRGDPARYNAMVEAAETAGREALAEALVVAHELGVAAHITLEHGTPEQTLVRLVRDGAIDLVAIRAREWWEPALPLGPHSVGHTARFVLDHTPCDVLLVRWETADSPTP